MDLQQTEGVDEKLAALATAMGVTSKDLVGFVLCLRQWIAKGRTFEEAIEANLDTWRMLLTNASEACSNPEYSKHRRGLDALIATAIECVHPAGSLA